MQFSMTAITPALIHVLPLARHHTQKCLKMTVARCFSTAPNAFGAVFACAAVLEHRATVILDCFCLWSDAGGRRSALLEGKHFIF